MATYDRAISTAATFTLTPDVGAETPTVVMLDDNEVRIVIECGPKSLTLRPDMARRVMKAIEACLDLRGR